MVLGVITVAWGRISSRRASSIASEASSSPRPEATTGSTTTGMWG